MKEHAGMVEQVDNDRILLQVRNLTKHYPIHKGFLQSVVGQVKAVDGVDLYVKDGETLGLVGESGCGKTSAGRCILRAIEPTGGEILFRDPKLGMVDIRKLDKDKLYLVRRNTQMIFQDPYGSLNPRMMLLQLVSEPMRAHRVSKGKDAEERVAYLLRVVGLRPEYMSRYPHAFSGGQRQRIGIARALAPQPALHRL
jgi:peptide/nickel transport system ATP-binding protein